MYLSLLQFVEDILCSMAVAVSSEVKRVKEENLV